MASYSPQGCKELDMTEMTEHTHTYTKKDLNDPDNYDGVITHLQPDILEYKVKWALLRTKLEEVREFQLNYLKS